RQDRFSHAPARVHTTTTSVTSAKQRSALHHCLVQALVTDGRWWDTRYAEPGRDPCSPLGSRTRVPKPQRAAAPAPLRAAQRSPNRLASLTRKRKTPYNSETCAPRGEADRRNGSAVQDPALGQRGQILRFSKPKR